jgi:hypothetical protein
LRAVFPAGMDAACDYMQVNLYPGFPPDPKTTMTPDAAHAKARVTMSQSEFLAQRDAASRLRKAELWRVLDRTGTPEVGNYMRLDYMKVQPGQRNEWIKSEQEIYKPIHKARIDLGGLKGWTLAALAMPSGSALPYDAMTVNMFKDWAQIGGPSKAQEAFQKVHPGKQASQVYPDIEKLRTIIRTELYEVIDVIRRSTMTGATQR